MRVGFEDALEVEVRRHAPSFGVRIWRLAAQVIWAGRGVALTVVWAK